MGALAVWRDPRRRLSPYGTTRNRSLRAQAELNRARRHFCDFQYFFEWDAGALIQLHDRFSARPFEVAMRQALSAGSICRLGTRVDRPGSPLAPSRNGSPEGQVQCVMIFVLFTGSGSPPHDDRGPVGAATAEGGIARASVVHDTIDGIQAHGGLRRGRPGTVLEMQPNRLVAPLVHEISAPYHG